MIRFDEGELAARRWTSLENLVCLSSVGSSNDLARELIELYFAEEQQLPSAVLVAEEQALARGRKGRWEAPRGRGLYWTILRRVSADEPLSLVPIAVARWTADAVRSETGVAVELKWPNDLYVRRRKLAGILSESRTQGSDTYVAVGVGLNVIGAAADLGVVNATTLEEEAGRPFALAPLLQAILDRFDREISSPRWESEVRRWESASLHHLGDRLCVRREGRELTGEYLGLSPEGFLRLRTPSGETVLTHGELAEW